MIVSDIEVTDSAKFDFLSAGLVEVNGSGNLIPSSKVLSSGSFIPTISNQTGGTITAGNCIYSRNSSVVTASFTMNITNSLTGAGCDITVPVNPSANFTATSVNAAGNTTNTGLTVIGSQPIVYSNNGTMTIHLQISGLALGNWISKFIIQYII